MQWKSSGVFSDWLLKILWKCSIKMNTVKTCTVQNNQKLDSIRKHIVSWKWLRHSFNEVMYVHNTCMRHFVLAHFCQRSKRGPEKKGLRKSPQLLQLKTRLKGFSPLQKRGKNAKVEIFLVSLMDRTLSRFCCKK